MILKRITRCRVCDSNALIPILSLGKQYVVAFPDDPAERAYKAPLDLTLCDPKLGGCGLLQLRHTFNHDILYRKYWFRSGISKTLVRALADIVKNAEALSELKHGDIVIDIGSNDGTLLKQYRNNKIIRVGFEPSNLWKLANDKNVISIHDYFNYNSYNKRFGGTKAKVITSIAMFYDLDDPNSFVEDINKCLAHNGIWIIQMNYLYLMLKDNTFDNISHEHLEYYSLLSLENLLKRHEMEVFDVDVNDVNGGSFRIFVKHTGAHTSKKYGAESRIEKIRKLESYMALDTKRPYREFAARIKRIRIALHNFFKNAAKEGKVTYVFGASTRGLVILQYAKIDHSMIRAATDKNKDKFGKYIVGTGIPIVPLAEYRKAMPDYIFVLPYHLINEIKTQERKFLGLGGKMIVAIPEFKIISK